MSADGFSTTMTEVDGIKRALNDLLRCAVSAKRYTTDRDGLRPIGESLARLLTFTEAQHDADGLIASPLGWAARMAIRHLGLRLFEIGGLDLMVKVLNDVAEMDPANWGARTSIMDRRWDGIGGWCS